MNCLEKPVAKKQKLENGVINHVAKQESEIYIKVGSRKSQLALFQTNYVVDLLKKKQTKLSYEIIPMSTTGDKILDVALPKIGEKSLFTKELEMALEKDEVHVIVHSLKDLPTTLPPGMVIGGICKREDPRDVVIFSPDVKCTDLKYLPAGCVIGTSSLRRIAQLKKLYPHLKFDSIRGNLNTRFRKLDEDKKFSAIVLAAAGVKRLDSGHRIGQTLSCNQCMYAVGQGALAIECKITDFETINLLAKISDQDTVLCCIAERAFLRKLEGGCSVPVAVQSSIENEKLILKGGVFSLDGSQSIIEKLSIKLNQDENSIPKEHYVGIVAPHIPHHLLNNGETLGIKLADLLLEKGAYDILKEARKSIVL